MTIGIRPSAGFALVDGEWLRQLSNGNNFTTQSGITAHAGGGQANALQLSNVIAYFEIDTVANANDSIMLPFSSSGRCFSIFNNGANTLNIYASPNNNPATGSPDVINKNANATAYQLTSGQTADFFCVKTGIWAAQKTA